MAKAMVKAGKAETPKAVKAKGAAAMPEEDVGTALVPMPKSGALSLDAGMTALKLIAAEVDAETQIGELRESGKQQRGMAQVTLAMSCYQAGLADKNINLAISLESEKTHKAEKNLLGKQIRLALGIYENVGNKTRYTKEADFFVNKQPGDDDKTLKRKASIRSNFSTMLTKSMRVALHAIENGLKLDTAPTGHLRITDGKRGNAVKQQFGMSSVVLNEDQNAKILDKKGNVIDTKQLKVKPSFTEVTRKVGEAHGKVIVARAESRTKTVSNDEYIVNVCGALIQAIAKLPDEVPEKVEKALSSLYSAIEKKIA